MGQVLGRLLNLCRSAPQVAPYRRAPEEKTSPRTNELKSESERLNTFGKWTAPLSPTINPTELAQAGFYYFNYKDYVQCPFCGGIVGKWEAEEVPILAHAQKFPDCPFIQGRPVGNIPAVH